MLGLSGDDLVSDYGTDWQHGIWLAGMACLLCLIGGIQLVCMGMIGEYIGKIYLETKARPRYIISERVGDAFMKDDGRAFVKNERQKGEQGS